MPVICPKSLCNKEKPNTKLSEILHTVIFENTSLAFLYWILVSCCQMMLNCIGIIWNLALKNVFLFLPSFLHFPWNLITFMIFYDSTWHLRVNAQIRKITQQHLPPSSIYRYIFRSSVVRCMFVVWLWTSFFSTGVRIKSVISWAHWFNLREKRRSQIHTHYLQWKLFTWSSDEGERETLKPEGCSR